MMHRDVGGVDLFATGRKHSSSMENGCRLLSRLSPRAIARVCVCVAPEYVPVRRDAIARGRSADIYTHLTL